MVGWLWPFLVPHPDPMVWGRWPLLQPFLPQGGGPGCDLSSCTLAIFALLGFSPSTGFLERVLRDLLTCHPSSQFT